MLDEPMTLENFVSKVAWEGGVVSALEHGLRASDIPEEELVLRHHWAVAMDAWETLQGVIAPIEDYLDERFPDRMGI